MIIKSMSRKTASFKQLIGYFHKEKHNKTLHHNFYDSSVNAEQLVNTFDQNSQHLATRKNWNFLYHEIISLETQGNIEASKLENILQEIGGLYLEKRAKHQLAYGVIHKDTNNIHLHLCISSNNLWEKGRVSLSKKQFRSIQEELESYVLEHFSELKQSIVYNKKPSREQIKTANTEQEFKRRTHHISNKEALKNWLHWLFESANTQPECVALLKQEKYRLYTRGKTTGIIHQETKKKHRLKTLWVLAHYEALQKRLSANEKNSVSLEASQKQNKQDELNRLTEQKKYTVNQQKQHFLISSSMNSKQAKQLPLVNVLQKLNFWSHHTKEKEVWYISPFRDEKTPSFKVNLNLNTWYDFWSLEGGGIIELFMKLYNENSISRIIWMIDRLWNLPPPTIQKTTIKQTTNSPIIQTVGAIQHSALIQYLGKRGLDVDLARLFLSEIHYQVGNQSYFWLANPNVKQGFELRNAYYKGCIWAKSISFIPSQKTGDTLAIFEGIYDFLSLLQLHKKTQAPHDVMIMNGVWLVEHVKKEVLEHDYKKIKLYLDNDKAGKEAAQKLKLLLPDYQLEDLSSSYANFKDLNEYLVYKNQLQIALDTSKQSPWMLLQEDREKELLYNFK